MYMCMGPISPHVTFVHTFKFHFTPQRDPWETGTSTPENVNCEGVMQVKYIGLSAKTHGAGTDPWNPVGDYQHLRQLLR